MHRPVVVVGYDGAELLDIACVTTTLAMANATRAVARPYRTTVTSRGGHAIRCGTGLVLEAQAALERVTGPIDTLVVSGGVTRDRAADDPVLVAHVRRLAGESRRVASVCTGASVLAAAGLLDGRRATIHWRFASGLAERYPRVDVDPAPIFVRDGHIATAAGITSALDLALAFVEEDHGVDLARSVSRELVTYLQRPGNQAQMSVFTAAPPPQHDLLARVIAHVHADLGAAQLAAMAGVSTRHLTRLFLRHTGQAPGRYVRRARTVAAALLLETTTLPLTSIATRCGLGTTESLRQAFVSQYRTAPSAYRAAVTSADPWDGIADEAASLRALLADRQPQVYSRYGHWWDKELPAAERRVLAG